MADSHNVNHDYHIIDPSPWPLIGAIAGLVTAIGGIAYMRALAESEFSVAGFDLAATGRKVLHHRCVQCVQLVRPVQPQPRHALDHVKQDAPVHGANPIRPGWNNAASIGRRLSATCKAVPA